MSQIFASARHEYTNNNVDRSTMRPTLEFWTKINIEYTSRFTKLANKLYNFNNSEIETNFKMMSAFMCFLTAIISNVSLLAFAYNVLCFVLVRKNLWSLKNYLNFVLWNMKKVLKNFFTFQQLHSTFPKPIRNLIKSKAGQRGKLFSNSYCLRVTRSGWLI